jgi:maltose O-acetyltransferase
MPTEKEKMLRGELYRGASAQLSRERARARDLMRFLNASREEDQELRQRIITKLFGAVGERIFIDPPFYCSFGSNLYVGDDVFINLNCFLLDNARIDIGDRVMLGPNVQLYTGDHPVDVETRRKWLEFAKPIRIGSDVFVGGGVIVCPGVTIGDGSVIGAGSVVTRDIPAGVVAAGNPCRVLRAAE